MFMTPTEICPNCGAIVAYKLDKKSKKWLPLETCDSCESDMDKKT